MCCRFRDVFNMFSLKLYVVCCRFGNGYTILHSNFSDSLCRMLWIWRWLHQSDLSVVVGCCRFGDGYTILIRVSGASPNLEPVERYINMMFPGSTLKERHHNMLQYQLGPTIKLSYIFGQIESVRHEFSIEDYSVSQTTLDQVKARLWS